MIDSPEKYQAGGEAPEKLALQFVPFTQGMLYVGSSAPLSDDEIALGQALADAFSVAYARYEDFRALEAKNKEVERAMRELKATQTQLIHSEKLASLGQLTAGIAHEIKNPLNFVNNFAEINQELAEELQDEFSALAGRLSDEQRDTLSGLTMAIRQNTRHIHKHGMRADGIVRSMMEHATEGTGERYDVGVNRLVDEYVNLSYHGMQAQMAELEVDIKRAYDEAIGTVEMVPQEIGRALMNVLNNAFFAVHEQAQTHDGVYTPTVTVTTRQGGGTVEIRVQDNGPGIPAAVQAKIFEPFFTTKPTGTGTGLGLSLSYDIVTQGHGGTLTVESTEGEGATFVITLPMNSPNTG